AQSKAAMARVRPASKPQPKPQAAPTPAAVPAASTALDAVLDKIAASGMESLTVAERLLLDEWSKRLRDVT
ncbi:MAG: DUF6576 domain-containing protein, partial [Gemmatimonas sp.]